MIGLVVAYAVSPVDLIPDFIPVLGWVDDLVLLPLGIWFAVRLVPGNVWAECLVKAEEQQPHIPPRWWIVGLIMAVWMTAVIAILYSIR